MEEHSGTRRRRAQPVPGSPRRRVVLMWLLATVALLAAVGLVLSSQLLGGGGNGPAAAADRTASPAVPPSSSSSETAEPAAVQAAAPQRLAVEAAGIDVAVLPLTPTADELKSQSLIPPYTEDGYWLTPYGTPGEGSENTTYITGHSWEDRAAPFDRLSMNTDVGDTVTVTTAAGTVEYVVDTVRTYNKDTLKDSEIWDIVPNRLVLISCYTADPNGKNVVVTASPAT